MRLLSPLLAGPLALLLSLPALAAPPPVPLGAVEEWAPGAVLYGVFLRSQGDVDGLLARLDALNDGNPHSFGDLGVDVLYLLRSPDVRVDIQKLVAATRPRGLKVLGQDLSSPQGADVALAAAILEGAKTGQAGGIAVQLQELARRSPQGVKETPFLAGPEPPALATRLGHDLGKEKSAAAVLLTLPGAPYIQAGEELGLDDAGGPGERSRQEKAFAAQTADPGSLLSHYRFLIRARHNSEALRKGTLTLLTPASATSATSASTPILAFLRQAKGETVLVVHNLGDTPVEAGPFAVPGIPDPFFASPGVTPPTGGAGAWKVKLPAHGSGIWKMR